MVHPTFIFAIELLGQDAMPWQQLMVLQTKNLSIMEIKLRANIVMSKELTIEANDWAEAVEKAQAMMTKPIPYRELTPTRVFYDEISPINGKSNKEWTGVCAIQQL